MHSEHEASIPITRRERLRTLIERRHGNTPWWAVLGRLLWIDGLTQAQAAKELGINRATVIAWAKDPKVRNYGATEPAA